MYKQNKPAQTSIRINKSYIGEMLEVKIDRMLTNKEPIKDPGVGLQYSERKEGVIPGADIRTDRFEVANTAMDKAKDKRIAERDKRMGKVAKENMDKETKNETGGQSTDTTAK